MMKYSCVKMLQHICSCKRKSFINEILQITHWNLVRFLDLKKLMKVFPFFFNWGIIALQYCSFCSRVKSVTYMYTYVPSPLGPLSHPTPFSYPSELSQRTELSFLCFSMFPLASYLMSGSEYISQCQSPNSPPHTPPQPWPCVHKAVFCICVSLPALWTGWFIFRIQ